MLHRLCYFRSVIMASINIIYVMLRKYSMMKITFNF